MTEVSSTRLYLGNLPRNATKADVEAHFQTHGTGEITEIKLMNGFGFIEYKDAMDARDVVPGESDFSQTLPIHTDSVHSFPYVYRDTYSVDTHLTSLRWFRFHG